MYETTQETINRINQADFDQRLGQVSDVSYEGIRTEGLEPTRAFFAVFTDSLGAIVEYGPHSGNTCSWKRRRNSL